MTMMLMLTACMAAWALVALMLGDARAMLLAALSGRPVQGGGWMPSAAPAPRAPVSRVLIRA